MLSLAKVLPLVDSKAFHFQSQVITLLSALFEGPASV